MNDLFDHTGKRIPLGNKIGGSAEGSVYDVPALGIDKAAKLYHKPLSPQRQAKLRDMAGLGDEALLQVAAWPLATLHVSKGGPVCGFLMVKLMGHKPLHLLFNPADRKRLYPGYDWAFLVQVARNVAAAFAAIHRHGHVVGDVNPNLVFFDRNGSVKLVDCDAFQIAVEGKHYPCELGIPHFTPPELLGYPGLRGLRRTPNHDNFGLALLVFHLLLMGQHPYAGVFLGEEDMSLEKAIGQFLYVFGRDAAEREIDPPPHAVTPDILPGPVARLFERAFGRQGAEPEGRPAAREWVEALDALQGRLRTCGKKPAHTYFARLGMLSPCPWCEQERYHGHEFFTAADKHAPPSPAGRGVMARAFRNWYLYALAASLFWFFIPKLIPTYINGSWLCTGEVPIREGAGADTQEKFSQPCEGTVHVKGGSETQASQQDGRTTVWIYVKTDQGGGWVDKSLVKYRTNPTSPAYQEADGTQRNP